MEENKSCYQFQKRHYENTLFNHVDATYIIHLKNNGRESNIEQQLSYCQPTPIVYLVENQGYKTCRKTLHEYTPSYDLTDAFLQSFKHAETQDYNNILILEDDYLFKQTPTLQESCNDIDNYINTLGTKKFIYYLGCVPYLQSTGFTNHNNLYLSSGTHACIYSKELRNHILQDYVQTDIIDWDVFHIMNLWNYPKYIYYKPLCCQIYQVTENSKHWYNPFGMSNVIKFTHSVTKVNNMVEPGHTIHYALSKLTYVLILFLLYWFILQSVVLGKKMKKIQK